MLINCQCDAAREEPTTNRHNFASSNLDTEAKLHFAYTSKNMTENATGKN